MRDRKAIDFIITCQNCDSPDVVVVNDSDDEDVCVSLACQQCGLIEPIAGGLIAESEAPPRRDVYDLFEINKKLIFAGRIKKNPKKGAGNVTFLTGFLKLMKKLLKEGH